MQFIQSLTQFVDNVIDGNSSVLALNAAVAELKVDVAELKVDVANLKIEVAELKRVQQLHSEMLQAINAKIDEMSLKMDRFIDVIHFLMEEHGPIKKRTKGIDEIWLELKATQSVVQDHISDKTIHLLPAAQ